MARSTSPIPSKDGTISLMDFAGAAEKMISGERVTKKEWNDENCYVFFGGENDEMLMIHIGDKSMEFRLRIPDIVGTDWYVLKSKKDEPD